MSEKSWTGILVGYSPRSKGYRIYNPKSGRVETSRDVRFSEEERYFPQEPMSQVFKDEGLAENEVEPREESEVTSESQGRV